MDKLNVPVNALTNIESPASSTKYPSPCVWLFGIDILGNSVVSTPARLCDIVIADAVAAVLAIYIERMIILVVAVRIAPVETSPANKRLSCGVGTGGGIGLICGGLNSPTSARFSSVKNILQRSLSGEVSPSQTKLTVSVSLSCGNVMSVYAGQAPMISVTEVDNPLKSVKSYRVLL